MNNKTYKLYHTEAGYKCQVNEKEIAFLFGTDATGTIDTINNVINKYGYYIK